MFTSDVKYKDSVKIKPQPPCLSINATSPEDMFRWHDGMETTAFKNRCVPSPDQALKVDLPRGENELLQPWTDTCPAPSEEEEQESVADERVVTHEPEDEDEDYAETQAEIDDDLYGL